MKYKAILKMRTVLYCAYIALGIAAVILGIYAENDFTAPLGAAFATVGVCGIIKHLRLIKNPSALKSAEIEENDERNIYIYQRARSLAFTITSLLAAIGIIVFGVMGEKVIMKTLAYILCAALVIYLICYYSLRRRG